MKIVNLCLACTVEDVANFLFIIRYTPGQKNTSADPLSRLYEPLAPSNVHMSAELPDGLIVLSKVDRGGDSSAQPGDCWLPCVFADTTTGYSLDLEVDAGK